MHPNPRIETITSLFPSFLYNIVISSWMDFAF
jgi:hypothetical protein